MRFERQDSRRGHGISGTAIHSSTERGSWRDFVPCGLLLVFSVVAIFLASMVADAHSTEVAVVAPPWADAADVATIVARSGGSIVASAGLPNIIIARSDDPEFVSTLYHAGAWLVLDAVKLRSCLSA
jgi:hypothetical protein